MGMSVIHFADADESGEILIGDTGSGAGCMVKLEIRLATSVTDTEMRLRLTAKQARELAEELIDRAKSVEI